MKGPAGRARRPEVVGQRLLTIQSSAAPWPGWDRVWHWIHGLQLRCSADVAGLLRGTSSFGAGALG